MIRSRFSRLFRFPRRDALDLALGIKPSIPASSSLDHGDRHWRCVAVLGMEMGLDAAPEDGDGMQP